MSKPASKTTIGIFVVVATALLVAAILILGSGKLFKNNPKYVMYFQGSVKGLSVGSPVVFRGVKVGTVTDIKMLLNPKDISLVIPVYVEFERAALEAMPGHETTEAYRRFIGGEGNLIKEMIGRGLRAQLEMQSIVTGQLIVSLDMHPDTQAKLVGFDHRYPEIPTIPTTLEQLAERLEKIPIEEIMNKLNKAIGGIEKIANSPDTAKMVTSIRQAVDDTRSLVRRVDNRVDPIAANMNDLATKMGKLVEHLDSEVGPLVSSITKTSEEAGVTLKKAQAAIGNIEDMTGEDSTVFYRLTKTLNDLRAATQSLRLLSDTLNQQPDAIVFGKKDKGGK